MTDERRPREFWILQSKDLKCPQEVFLVDPKDLVKQYKEIGRVNVESIHVREVMPDDSCQKREETENIRAVYVKLDRTQKALAKAKEAIIRYQKGYVDPESSMNLYFELNLKEIEAIERGEK